MRAVIAVPACALVLPGCGRGAEGGAKRSGRLVDFSQKPPYVNALDIDPATGDFLMTTNNRGFFRIDARTHAVARVRATAWPAADALYRAEKDGTVSRSRDGGERWERVGTVPGEPYEFKALRPERLDLALSDGTIVATQDGGRHSKQTFRR